MGTDWSVPISVPRGRFPLIQPAPVFMLNAYCFLTESVMTETPDKAAAAPPSLPRTPRVKSASMLRLMLGRPRLSVPAARTLGWFTFIVLAILPLCAAAAAVLYLTSSRWPADFSARLSRSTGLEVTVGQVIGFSENSMELLNVGISARPGLPPILSARTGTYEIADLPTLSLRQVVLDFDLDWWTASNARPGPNLFFPVSSSAKPPVLDLHRITAQLHCDGHTYTVRADAGTVWLTDGVVHLKLTGVPASDMSQPFSSETSPRATQMLPPELLTASLGYQQGIFVKVLTVRQAPVELIRDHLGKVLGEEWSSAFPFLSGDITFQQPIDEANWRFSGRGTLSPSSLKKSAGLSGLGGDFDVTFDKIACSDDQLLQGTLEISLIRNPYKLPTCSIEALKGLQLMATGTTPLLADGVKQLPFDRLSAVITVNRKTLYIQAPGEGNVVMSCAGVEILSLPPQSMTRQEWLRRLKFLHALWAESKTS